MTPLDSHHVSPGNITVAAKWLVIETLMMSDGRSIACSYIRLRNFYIMAGTTRYSYAALDIVYAKRGVRHDAM